MKSTIRAYRPADIPGITRIVNAADSFYKTEEGTSEQELAHEFSFPGLDPEQNVFVAEEDAGIVGYAVLRFLSSDTEDSFRTWFQVQPEKRGEGLEDELLESLYRRAQARLPECKTDHRSFSTRVSGSETERIAAITRAGMVEVRRGWLMLCPSLDDVPDPRFPDGFTARPYRVGLDDAGMHRADTEVFRDHWGHVDMPFEMWQHYVARESFKPDLSIVAQEGATGEIAGFCTIAINDGENARLGVRRGWIDIVGVRRAYRKKGLGTALVLAGMRHLRDARMDQAALGCDAENQTGATRIYKRVGFVVHREQLIFSREMSQHRPTAF